jgi:hypothetical protein
MGSLPGGVRHESQGGLLARPYLTCRAASVAVRREIWAEIAEARARPASRGASKPLRQIWRK